ncbi:MAG: TIGR04283 family arsenosugar biosynthesis glycosyltransferase [Nitrospirota bacterium]
MISIIIPVLNEEKNISAALENIERLDGEKEVIIVDGGSIDNTVEIVKKKGVMLLSSQKGRGCQMNKGAEIANGDTLLFLHADTTLPENALLEIERVMKVNEVIGGRFDVRFDDDRFVFKLIAFLMNWRSRLTSIFTGDQAIFIRKSVFKDIGGYLEIPLMEDIALSKKMKRTGRVACLGDSTITSARKWKEEGIIKTILLMWFLRLLYFFKISPIFLSKIYYRKG